jgi:hypothetical protein
MTKLAGLVVVSVATVSLATACGPVRSEAGHSLGAGVQVTAAAALPDPRNATYPDAEIVAAVVTGHLAHDSVVDAAAYLESIQHSLRCSIGFRPEWVPAGRAYALRERAARSSILEEIVAANHDDYAWAAAPVSKGIDIYTQQGREVSFVAVAITMDCVNPGFLKRS